MLSVFMARQTSPSTQPAHQGQGMLRVMCPAHESVLVWGWAAELYSYYDWQPASRYVTYGLLKATTPHQEAYRERFLEEMAEKPPRCVVNAVGPAWFLSTPEDPPLETAIPESRPWLDRCYTQETVSFTPEDPVSVWLRTDAC
jgi:hypothetical protein